MRLGFRTGHALFLLLAWTGCPDPGADFDDFAKRAGTSHDAGPVEQGGCALPEGALPAPEQLSGTFLFSVSTTVGRDRPFVFLLDVDVSRSGARYEITIVAQPLAANDRKTPVGAPTDPQTFSVEAGGCFTSVPQLFALPAGANPILPVQATSELSFSGNVGSALRDARGAVTFWCGQVNGRSVTPLPMNIDGSTFAATRVTNPAQLPPVVINCAMDPARPL
ncbi:MAG TPA: hypothetical protein VI299_15985 [Polyangiales bacterium]